MAWCKGKPYKLGHPAQDAELCKDTTALANARGGLLLAGNPWMPPIPAST